MDRRLISDAHTGPKTSRKGPRNRRSDDQSTTAKTISAKVSEDPTSRAWRKSRAVRRESLPKAPHPQAPTTSVEASPLAAFSSTRWFRRSSKSPDIGWTTLGVTGLDFLYEAILACLGNPDPVGMKVYAPAGEETFDDIQTTEEAQAGADRREAA